MSQKTVLQDFAEANPRTVCQISGQIFLIQLIDARHALVEGGLTSAGLLYAEVDLPEVVYHWFVLRFRVQGPEIFVTVGPGLDQAVWLQPDYGNIEDIANLVTARGDSSVGQFPSNHYVGSCVVNDYSPIGAAFSASGKFIMVFSNSNNPLENSLLVIDLPKTSALPNSKPDLVLIPPPAANAAGPLPSLPWPPGEQPEAPIWSPTTDTLYYSQKGSIYSWTSYTGSQVFLPGVTWYYPAISADGRYLAYMAVRGPSSYVSLVDLVNGGAPRATGNDARTLPIFLTSNLLWYRSPSTGSCESSQVSSYVYDVNTGTESISTIAAVYAVWPARSAY